VRYAHILLVMTERDPCHRVLGRCPPVFSTPVMLPAIGPVSGLAIMANHIAQQAIKKKVKHSCISYRTQPWIEPVWLYEELAEKSHR
jgi:hypothetical protein